MDLYSEEQMIELMSITRTWALNNPSGPVPMLPLPAYKYQDNLLRKRANDRYSYPKYKDPHWIIRVLIKIRIL